MPVITDSAQLTRRDGPTVATTQKVRSTFGPTFMLADVIAVVLGAWLSRAPLDAVSVAGAAAGLVVVNHGLHLYQSRLVLSVLEDIPALLCGVLVAALLYMGLLGPGTLGDDAPATSLRLRAAIEFGVVAGLALLLLRGVAYALVRDARRHGLFSHPVIIVGTGDIATRLALSLKAEPRLGLRPVGMVDDGHVRTRALPLPFLGGLNALPHAMHALEVNDVIFAFGNETDERTLSLVRHVQQMQAQVFVVPRFFEMMGLDRPSRVEVIHDVSVVRLRRWRIKPHAMLVKRGFDVVFSGAALLALSPVMAIIALAVRRETGPGVIFRQERVGRGGRTFELLKFRSLKATTTESATTWNIDQDDRIGPVGRFLRRTGADELPQLWNILRGDMSLVGPRPERPVFVQRFSQETRGYAARHRVHVGLTGWAQVHHLRGDTSIADRIRADNYYIENWSLWGDIKIVVRTLRTLRRNESTAPYGARVSAEFELPSA